MSDAPEGPSAEDTHYEEYLDIASGFLSDTLHSRAGFAAFRHFEGIQRDTVRLIARSSFFSNRQQHEPFLFHDPDYYFHYMLRRGSFPFFSHSLSSPASYDPPAVWALFWALARAEHEFLYQFVPFWSNEERLTGHLVSQVFERIREFGTHWTSLDLSSKEESFLRISYADTATARREGITGADLGLVVHGRFSSREEFFKVARFQAKKADRNKTQIRLDQTQGLECVFDLRPIRGEAENQLRTLRPRVGGHTRHIGRVQAVEDQLASRRPRLDDSCRVRERQVEEQ